ncbi:hypothetical protein [Actinocorallia populi]|uniref:hypothetical protein n=1 Tax=Actinocorallia populi TaxID=2079200 RepID=UPI000D0898FA|nr:hypothetical protein [Actinocorallia populi]
MYLLCDIDGVHIPFPAPNGEIPVGFQPQFVTPTGHDEPVKIWLNPATGRLLLNAIADLPLTPLWCSSWRADSAPLIGHPLGLPTWEHLDLPLLSITTSHPNGYLWKRDTVTPYIGDHPLIWIDDDFTPADHTWAAHRTTSGTPTLLIQPDPHQGLRASDLAPLETWRI